MTTDALGMLLGTLALVLTLAMFISNQAMLGFPCGIFWAVLGGFAYTQSATTWDMHYFLFFASMGMAIFSIFAAYGLRTKKEEAEEGDLYFDEGGDKDVKFLDEGGKSDTEDEEDKPRRTARNIRERATRRRERWD